MEKAPHGPLAWILWLALMTAAWAEPPRAVMPAESTIPFHRIHVPEGRLGEVPLGGRRFVPMTLEDFEAALAASGGEPPPGATRGGGVPEVTCRVTLNPDGRLRGTSSFEVPENDLPRVVSLGSLPVRRAVREGDGVGGDVTIHGTADELGCVVARPGRYRIEWELPPSEEGGRFVVPMLPSLRTLLEFELPPGVVPLVERAAGGMQPVGVAEGDPPVAGGGNWRLDVGPVRSIAFTPLTARESTRYVRCWQHVVIGRGAMRIDAVIVPTAPWRTDTLRVDVDPRLHLQAATVALPDDGVRDAELARDPTDMTTVVRLPAGALGTIAALEITAVAPLPDRGGRRRDSAESSDDWLPLIRPLASDWAGGGIRIECEAGLAPVDIGVESCLAVAEEKTSGWPLEPGPEPPGDRARVSFEAQGPQARVRVGVGARAADLDVARVTTADIGPAIVTGRAACDLRVRSGEAFEVTGRVAPGWIIDSVEAVEWRGIGGERTSAVATVDWRMVRDRRGESLRIGFPTAATPQRGVTLSIAGHRGGIGTEVPFTGNEVDMLRLDGETPGLAVLALTSPPETTIELDPPSPPPASPPERLAALVPKAAIRAWIPRDDAAMSAPASLLERRPPVDADTRVRLTVLDERITESFTFSCTPGASALDAVVVHFSEPTDDLLEWSLLPPASGTLSVRRIDRRGGRAGEAGGGEAWLVELQPPARGEVRIHAARVIPFGGAVAVPLAWVDGSDPRQGSVAIVNAGRRRPQIVNRRLEELPPAGRSDDDESPKGTLAEFAFTPPTGVSPSASPAAEVLPGGRDRDDEARAWVWNEETTCWCHPTGVTEYETRFDIENHGRTNVAVTPPAAVLARGVVIDGVPAAVVPDVMTGAWRVDLPADRRFIRLVIRSETTAAPSRLAWEVPLAAAGIDVPVLERIWRVLLPDAVDIVTLPTGFREVAADRGGWLQRLLPVTVRGRSSGGVTASSPRSRQGTIDAGFQERILVQRAGRGTGGRIRLVHTRWLRGAGLLGAVVFAAVGFLAAGRTKRLLVAVALAVAALWLPPPLDGPARAGVWGLAVAALLRRAVVGRNAATPLLAAALVLAGAGRGAATEPLPPVPPPAVTVSPTAPESLPVFIVPGARSAGRPDAATGPAETALVPETLYRTLSAALGRRAARGVRVHAVRLRARPATDGVWTLEIDLDAEAGGLITLLQERGIRWDDAGPRLDGRRVAPTPDSDGQRLGIGFANAGRHRLELGLDVTAIRTGEVDVATVAIPFAPRAELLVEGPLPPGRGEASILQVDAIDAAGIPRRVRRADEGGGTGVGFDVSRAARVRLAWAADGASRIVDTIPVAESRNDLVWSDGGCRLNASYAIDPGDQIVRGVVIRSDPRLEALSLAEPGFVASRLGGGRFHVELAEPRRGRIAFSATFQMPLADPVGFFDLPSAWLESVTSDARTSQLEPAPDLVVKATLPEDATLLPPRGGGTPGVVSWRIESGRGVRQGDYDGAAAGGGTQTTPSAAVPVRLAVERRRQPLRGSQRADVSFTTEAVRLRLESRIDAVVAPLVTIGLEIPEGCDVEQVSLREDAAGPVAAADPGPIGVQWRRDGRGRILVVVERPRPGVFLLELEATLPGPPARSGTVPLLRALLEQGGPLTVTWRAGEGRGAVVGGDEPGEGGADRRSAAPSGSLEVPADGPAPTYRLIDVGMDASGIDDAGGGGVPSGGDVGPPIPPTPVAEASPDEDPSAGRVEFAETHLAIDARGRAWGVSRFDVVAVEPVIRIRIPAGMRMFDVFVDGRIANDAVPARSSVAENAWELRLLDVGWPRSIVAVYAGAVADALPGDGVLDIPAPGIVGLECLRAAWVVDLPEGIVARPSPPTATVDEQTLTAARRGAIERLAAGFERAIARATPDGARRLGDFLRQARREAVLPLPAAWSHVGLRDSQAAAAWAPPLRFLQERDASGLRIVFARRADGSVAGRAIVTAIMLLSVVTLLEARRRTPLVSRLASAILGPWWAGPLVAVGAGGCWIATLDPAWPGWIAAAVGLTALVVWMPRPTRARSGLNASQAAAIADAGTVARSGSEAVAGAGGRGARGAVTGSTVRPGG